MDGTVLLTSVLIAVARMADVALGTLRTVCIIQGRRGTAWILGFAEILIWVFAVSKVIHNLEEPAYAVSYAFGFATGNFVGMTIERWLAFGRQVVQVFTREGRKISTKLREEGFIVTSFEGEGRDGPVQMLYIEIPRTKTHDITLFVREIDPKCFFTISDIRTASRSSGLPLQPTGWRAIHKKK